MWFITVISLYQRMTKVSYTLSCIKQNDIKQRLSFSISFVCLVVIPLILCVIPLWNSATAHSPSGKELTFYLRKMTVFQGVASRRTIFTSSCVISLWDSATAHLPSSKELKLSSQEESCFSGLIVLLMFSRYPAWVLFGLVLTDITH